MRMNHGVLAIIVAIVFCVDAPAGELSIVGFTRHWKNGEDYVPLPEVKVVVSRNGSYVKSTVSKMHRGEAQYELVVRSGEPIQVVFHLSPQFVPEAQSLSARDGDRQQISTALLSVKQYREMHEANRSMPSLKEKLRSISQLVPRESPIFDEIVRMVQDSE